jgi:MFS family permease
MLLDGGMTLFATLTLYLLARYGTSQRPPWLYAAGASMGLTFLSKETGIVLLAAVYAFFALCPSIRLRLRELGISMACMALVISPYPLTLLLAGGGGASTTQQYLIWQLLRRPNHEWDFYPTAVGSAIGPLLILVATLGVLLLRKERSWRETLLLAWVLIPIIFFQAWPVKGFHYLLLVAPPIAVLAGSTLGRWHAIVPAARKQRPWIGALLAGAVAASLAVPSWIRIHPSPTGEFLAGSGGVPGGREAGLWINEHSPEGASLMTIGPSMANILQFYGHRSAMGLSVSPNPLHRNPSYRSIRNPDFEIRTGEFQYLVWDAYSAARSSFFSEKLLDYARRYNGRVVHTESISTIAPSGQSVEKPVIVIYEVRP